ncbi:Histidine kinase-, DNA gyrase B-, and HSP90-like ATPase [[Clostridium] cf. saccharolyticum K10]|nr:Histidine kinase-, DNA gyrase B-, and HSP90-like ATPase [[Clostridium] cf. saccharolyticum K10]
MNLCKRAFLYSIRKKGKTLTLLAFLLVMATLMLTCFSIQSATETANANINLKRTFTFFYRVDKSRNRNSGGSGLGLYITKMILDHHGISYSMENTENGVRFTALFRLL